MFMQVVVMNVNAVMLHSPATQFMITAREAFSCTDGSDATLGNNSMIVLCMPCAMASSMIVCFNTLIQSDGA